MIVPRGADSLLVRVYGDSLSLPRAADSVTYRDTYPEIVQSELLARTPEAHVAFYNRSRAGTTIDALYEHYLSDTAYFGVSDAQCIVIQCGIVDCAPRPIPKWLRTLISMLPGHARAPITYLLHRARPGLLRAGLSWRFTSERRFGAVLSDWLAHACMRYPRTYVYNIAPTLPSTEAHSPGLTASIAAYNELIAEAVAAAPEGRAVLLDIHRPINAAADPSLYVDRKDGHHITRAGHVLYAKRLLAFETDVGGVASRVPAISADTAPERAEN